MTELQNRIGLKILQDIILLNLLHNIYDLLIKKMATKDKIMPKILEYVKLSPDKNP